MNETQSDDKPAATEARAQIVGDAEREYVVGLLQRATGKGIIDLDAFTRRTDTAYAARTRAELNTVLTDLPGLVHTQAPPADAETTQATGSGADGKRLELRAHHSNLTRNGRWHVPERMLVRNRYGSTKLDFTEAQIDASLVHVELDAKWGSVLIIIAEAAAVDVNAITQVKYGSLEDKTRSTGKDGSPRIVLSGQVHGGSLTIRNPKRGFFGGGC